MHKDKKKKSSKNRDRRREKKEEILPFLKTEFWMVGIQTDKKKGTTKNKCVRVRVAKEEEKIAIP